jgi:hypothetical protein
LLTLACVILSEFSFIIQLPPHVIRSTAKDPVRRVTRSQFSNVYLEKEVKVKKAEKVVRKSIETTIYQLLEGVAEPAKRGRRQKINKALVID